MTFKEIQELIKLVSKSKLNEFKVKDGDFEMIIRSENYTKSNNSTPIIQAAPSIMPIAQAAPAAVPAPAAPVAAAPATPAAAAAPAEKEDTSKYIEIKSPMIGTFYRSASPEKPVYVSVGDKVDKNSVVCIIEAMKLFNEIEAEVTGTIVKVLVEDSQPVEYDQPLFLVDPS